MPSTGLPANENIHRILAYTLLRSEAQMRANHGLLPRSAVSAGQFGENVFYRQKMEDVHFNSKIRSKDGVLSD